MLSSFARPPGAALAEALNPRTSPERLVQLSVHPLIEVQRAAWRNPNMLTSELREKLQGGSWDAWANPATELLLLEHAGADDLIRGAMAALVLFLPEQPALVPLLHKTVVPVLEGWWQTTHDLDARFWWLGRLGRRQGERSAEHVRAVRAAWQLVRLALPAVDDRRKDMDHLLTMVECWFEGDRIDVTAMVQEGRVFFEQVAPHGSGMWLPKHHAAMAMSFLTRGCLLGAPPQGGVSDAAADAPRKAVMSANAARILLCGDDHPNPSAEVDEADRSLLRHLFPRCPMRAPFERLDAVDHPPPHPLPG